MISMSKRKLPILFLLLLLFQPLCYWVMFKLQQAQVRHEIKAQLKAGVAEAQLVLLKIPQRLETMPNADFQRIHAREFRYQGEMYDIARQETHGDTTWYYCISDHEETSLFARLDALVAQTMNNDPFQKNQTTRLLQWLNAFFLPLENEITADKATSMRLCTTEVLQADQWHSAPPAPPPWI